jgi:putative transposase
VHELRQHYPLLGLLKLAALPRSTFYHRHNASLRVDKDAQLKTDIETIYARHKGRYGYRRITAAVRQMGKLVNHKLVQRLMGELGLKSLVRPKRYRSTREKSARQRPMCSRGSSIPNAPTRNGSLT